MAERIHVSGFRRPFVRPTPMQRARSVVLIRPLNLIGIAGAVGVLVGVILWGTPHVLLATTSSGTGPYRFYGDCAYAGLDGRMIHLRGASCPLVRLLKSNSRS